MNTSAHRRTPKPASSGDRDVNTVPDLPWAKGGGVACATPPRYRCGQADAHLCAAQNGSHCVPLVLGHPRTRANICAILARAHASGSNGARSALRPGPQPTLERASIHQAIKERPDRAAPTWSWGTEKPVPARVRNHVTRSVASAGLGTGEGGNAWRYRHLPCRVSVERRTSPPGEAWTAIQLGDPTHVAAPATCIVVV